MGQIFQFIVLITENAHNHFIETVLGFFGPGMIVYIYNPNIQKTEKGLKLRPGNSKILSQKAKTTYTQTSFSLSYQNIWSKHISK